MNTEKFERKLTAILSSDVQGYSRLMGDDEDETVRTLTAHRRAIAKLVVQYRGRVVDFPDHARTDVRATELTRYESG